MQLGFRSCWGRGPVLLLLLLCTVTSTHERIQKRAIDSGSSRPQYSSTLCLSKTCVNSASRILNKMDTSTNPCDDFFQFACGDFVASTVIPDDRSSENIFSVLREELLVRMRQLVDTPATPDDSSATTLIKQYYSSCVDKDGIEALALKPLQDMLSEMGGWPVVEGGRWNSSAFQWTEQTYSNRRLGYSTSYLFSFGVYTDYKHSSKRTVDIDDPALGMGRKYLIKGFDDKFVQAYYKYMVEMALALGADEESAKQEMKESLLFEIKLANLSLPKEKRRNVTQLYNPTPIRELQKKVPDISWLQYINTLLGPAGVQVTEDEVVIVNHLDYLKDMTKLLRETPARVQANYLLWRVVRASVGELNMQARDIRLRYYDVVSGTSEHRPRWKECLNSVLTSFTIAAGSLYVQNHFSAEEKRAALTMVTDIHKTFDNLLNQIDWMDDVTRQRALNKSSTIAYHIGYPEELFNNTLVGEFYNGLSITSDDLFGNVRRQHIFNLNYAYGKLREPVDKLDWREHGKMAVVNAFYRVTDNSISFPAGILQGDFYGGEKPRYLNYGAIGMVIGHEITHGFDDRGRQFDSQGELNGWWQPATNDKFVKKTKCMINQYGNITDGNTGLKLNGITTQGENIADNGGVKVARLAYDRYQRQHGREAALPGLQQYTNEQMFWLGFAGIWCGVYRPESLRKLILTDPHAPSYSRVNQPLKNIRQFAADWQCPSGSPMNPEHRCDVW